MREQVLQHSFLPTARRPKSNRILVTQKESQLQTTRVGVPPTPLERFLVATEPPIGNPPSIKQQRLRMKTSQNGL